MKIYTNLRDQFLAGIFLLTVLFVIPQPGFAEEQELTPETLTEAVEMVKANGYDDAMESMIPTIATRQIVLLRSHQANLSDAALDRYRVLVEAELKKQIPNFNNLLALMFAKQLPLGEMITINNFLKTEAGKHFVEVATDLQIPIMQATEQWVTDAARVAAEEAQLFLKNEGIKL